MGVLVPRRQRAASAYRGSAGKTQARVVWRDHVQAEEAGGSGASSGTSRQGLFVLQPDRHHAAEIQSRYLHSAMHFVSRESAELHSQADLRRLRETTEALRSL